MGALAIMVISFAGYIIMYQLYGKFIGSKIFALSGAAKTPAVEMEDGIDYVPTKKEIIFGHHYTSIAGTGARNNIGKKLAEWNGAAVCWKNWVISDGEDIRFFQTRHAPTNPETFLSD